MFALHDDMASRAWIMPRALGVLLELWPIGVQSTPRIHNQRLEIRSAGHRITTPFDTSSLRYMTIAIENVRQSRRIIGRISHPISLMPRADFIGQYGEFRILYFVRPVSTNPAQPAPADTKIAITGHSHGITPERRCFRTHRQRVPYEDLTSIAGALPHTLVADIGGHRL